jgi:uncharacterized protein
MIGLLTPSEIEEILTHEAIAFLGCSADAKPYVVPIWFAWDGASIFGFTSEGKKVHVLRQNPHACVTIARVENIVNWRSVIATGDYQELHGVEIARALDLIYSRIRPHLATAADLGVRDLMERVAHDGVREVVYRIRVTELSGRYERHEAPGVKHAGQAPT